MPILPHRGWATSKDYSPEVTTEKPIPVEDDCSSETEASSTPVIDPCIRDVTDSNEDALISSNQAKSDTTNVNRYADFGNGEENICAPRSSADSVIASPCPKLKPIEGIELTALYQKLPADRVHLEPFAIIEAYNMPYAVGKAFEKLLTSETSSDLLDSLEASLWYVNRVISNPITAGNIKTNAPSALEIATVYGLTYPAGSIVESIFDYCATGDIVCMVKASTTLEYMIHHITDTIQKDIPAEPVNPVN